MCSRSPKNHECGYFHVIVLKRMTEKCNKVYKAREEPLFH